MPRASTRANACCDRIACFGLSGVSLRYFNVFGPRQRHDSPYAAVVPRFIDSLRRGQPPVIFGDGAELRDFTHVENVVQANLLAGALAKPVCGEAINIACGERISVLDLLKELHRMMKVCIAPAFAPPRAGDVPHSLADISAARALIGYAPGVSVRDGLRRMIETQGGPRSGPLKRAALAYAGITRP